MGNVHTALGGRDSPFRCSLPRGAFVPIGDMMLTDLDKIKRDSTREPVGSYIPTDLASDARQDAFGIVRT